MSYQHHFFHGVRPHRNPERISVLWAKWQSGWLQVKLGANGGTGGSESFKVRFGEKAERIKPPTRVGYEFDGYWTSVKPGGVQYFNPDGVASRAWDIAASVSLWAKWKRVTPTRFTDVERVDAQREIFAIGFKTRIKICLIECILFLLGKDRTQRQLLRDVLIVGDSRLFNSNEYLLNYPDVKIAQMDPVWHYCRYGWKQGRLASSRFCTYQYTKAHPELLKEGKNPLVYYLSRGQYIKGEGRWTCREFSNIDSILQKEKLVRDVRLTPAKPKDSFIVTTIITAYNHGPYIAQAIESVLCQRGDFVHEIIISSDGSSDDTRKVIRDYADKYPSLIQDLSEDYNVGISENMRRCFNAASGKYIAVLEGDDYWSCDCKLMKQVRFLETHRDCSMVFNRLNMLNTETLQFSLLPRQKNLHSRLTGEDFIRDPNQNLIANFSCCMFSAAALSRLPVSIFKVRFNEISLAFAIERIGPLGFMPDVLTVYRVHPGSTWSTADRRKKLLSSIACREKAFELCADKYKDQLGTIIDALRGQLNNEE